MKAQRKYRRRDGEEMISQCISINGEAAAGCNEPWFNLRAAGASSSRKCFANSMLKVRCRPI